MNRLLLVLLVVINVPAYSLELNDAHIHYNRDVWDKLSPQRALQILSDNHINRAIVSSTPTEGTEKMYRAAPGQVIPFLRPYRHYRDRGRWFADPAMIDYVTKHLATGIYQGFGEFHLFSANKDTPVIRQLVKILAEKRLTLSAHSDAETIQALFDYQPTLRIIWAHCGFDHPLADVIRLLEKYPTMYCELSFRKDITDADDKLRSEWRLAFEKFGRRFLLGMDTYIPSQWASVPENASYAQLWLKQLSPKIAQLIATQNIERMFPLK